MVSENETRKSKGERKFDKNGEKFKKKIATHCVLIPSAAGGGKQTDKEWRHHKEKMDCYIFKHPQAAEKREDGEREKEKAAYFLPGLQA